MSEAFDNPLEEAGVDAALPLPGSVLRAAREARGYSLAEVAQVLKFGVRQLEALESDDYSNLTGTTFIRGFVRSYARFLKLDETPLLAALEPQAPVAVAEVHAVESVGAEMPAGGADGSKRAYGLAVAVLLLGAIAWFVWQEQAEPAVTPQLAEPATATVAPEAASDAVSVPEPVKPVVAAPAAAATDAPAVTPPNTSVIPAAGISEPVATVSEVTPVAAPTPNERQLLLAFGGVSWVEVRDASNRILYSGNSTPDSRQTVRGRPPFQLVIGNAQSVKLRYEDRSIDLQPYTRVDVARLTLDDNTK